MVDYNHRFVGSEGAVESLGHFLAEAVDKGNMPFNLAGMRVHQWAGACSAQGGKVAFECGGVPEFHLPEQS